MHPTHEFLYSLPTSLLQIQKATRQHPFALSSFLVNYFFLEIPVFIVFIKNPTNVVSVEPMLVVVLTPSRGQPQCKFGPIDDSI